MSVVIVAVDGTEAADRAAAVAHDLFPRSELIVATVVRPVPTGPPSSESAIVRRATRLLGLDLAGALVRRLGSVLGDRARVLVLTGEPVEALCALARQEHAAAIVVGAVGGHRLDPLLGPSVGSALVAHAPCAIVELGAPPRTM